MIYSTSTNFSGVDLATTIPTTMTALTTLTTSTMATAFATMATKHLFGRFPPDPMPEKKTAEKLLYKVEITFLEEQTNPSGKIERNFEGER